MSIQAIEHIKIAEKSGVPRLAGHRLTVHHIVLWFYRHGHTVEEIAEMYNLSLGQVYAALSFYHDNKELVDGFIAAGDRAPLRDIGRYGQIIARRET